MLLFHQLYHCKNTSQYTEIFTKLYTIRSITFIVCKYFNTDIPRIDKYLFIRYLVFLPKFTML